MEKTNVLNTVTKVYDASNYFWVVLHVLFYGDEEDDEMKMDMNMFSKFCEQIKNTYLMFYHGGSSIEMIHMLKPFSMLMELSLFPEAIDEDHDIIQVLSDVTARAIKNIYYPWSEENAIVVNEIRWYDFENDTPEDVWNRIKLTLKAD